MLKNKVSFYLIGFGGFLDKKSDFLACNLGLSTPACLPCLQPWPATLACNLGLLPWPVTLAQIDPCMLFALYLDYDFLK